MLSSALDLKVNAVNIYNYDFTFSLKNPFRLASWLVLLSKHMNIYE